MLSMEKNSVQLPQLNRRYSDGYLIIKDELQTPEKKRKYFPPSPESVESGSEDSFRDDSGSKSSDEGTKVIFKNQQIVPPHSKGISIPLISCTTFLFQQLKLGGDKIFLVDSDNGFSLSYHDVLNRSQRAVTWFKKETNPGEVVCIFARNRPDYIVAFLGISGAGATVCHVNPEYTNGELARTIDEVNGVCIISDPENLHVATQVASKCQTIRKIVVFSSNTNDVISFEDVVSLEPSEPIINGDSRKITLHILTSSGTTGLPKLVSLSHYSRVANIIQLSDPNFRVCQPNVDTLLMYMPMHLMFATVLWTHALYEQATVVIQARFKPEPFLSAIQDHKVTVLPLVPSLAYFLSESHLTELYDLTSLRKVVSGGAPLAPSLADAVQKKFHLESFRPGYGMTETGHITFVPHSECNYKSIGQLLPATEIEVRDVISGSILGPNETGEFWFRGPQLMQGYLSHKNVFDTEGWLRSGDAGYFNESGEYFFVERIKDILKVKGQQVAPVELEILLAQHPGVADVAVVGLPDPWAGELPLAFVVPADEKLLGSDIKGVESEKMVQSIQAFVAERTCRIKHLVGGVRFIQIIPRTGSGKILRRFLRELLVEKENV